MGFFGKKAAAGTGTALVDMIAGLQVPDLRFYFPITETPPTVPVDRGPNAIVPTIENGPWVDGGAIIPEGGGSWTPASARRLVLADSEFIDFAATDVFTLFYVQQGVNPGGREAFVVRRDQGYYHKMIQFTNGKLETGYDKSDSSGSHWKDSAEAGQPAQNATAAIAAVYNGNLGSNHFKFYVNGALSHVVSSSATPLTMRDAATPLYVFSYNSSNQHAAGKTAHVAMWGRELTAAEIYRISMRALAGANYTG